MKLEDALGELSKQLQYINIDIGAAFIELAKDRTPVDTGKLRDSWVIAGISSGLLEIENTADYAVYVENGTEKQTPSAMGARTIQAVDEVLAYAAIKNERR